MSEYKADSREIIAAKKTSAVGLLMVVGFVALCGFSVGLLSGLLDEESGSVSLGLDHGWKSALLFILTVVVLFPIGAILTRSRLPSIVVGMILMGAAFASISAGETIIAGDTEHFWQQAMSGSTSGLLIGFAIGMFNRTAWAKSRFSTRSSK